MARKKGRMLYLYEDTHKLIARVAEDRSMCINELLTGVILNALNIETAEKRARAWQIFEWYDQNADKPATATDILAEMDRQEQEAKDAAEAERTRSMEELRASIKRKAGIE